MGEQTGKRRMAAVLAADVAGYSRLMGADEEATIAALGRARTVFRERDQLDLERGQITLYDTKTSRPRVIPLHGPITDDARITLSSIPSHIAGTHVFWHGKGAPYSNFSSRFAAITKAVAAERAAQDQPFRRFRAHDLRHKFAVDYLRAGGDIYRLSRILGHASVKTTEIYLAFVDLDVSKKVSNVQRFAAALGDIAGS